MKKQKVENIFFTSNIEMDHVSAVLYEIQEIQSNGKIPRLILCGYGGSNDAGQYLYDQIKLMFPNLIIIGSGTLQSMAIAILLSAKRENRFITKNTTTFFHEPRLRGPKKNDVSISSRKFKKLNRVTQELITRNTYLYNKIITNETNLTLEKLIRIEKRETWFKPKEMVKYGFASKIITNLDEI
jgi:ATP-dependent protease ClpP protease subunit